jgi:hypothetical protein
MLAVDSSRLHVEPRVVNDGTTILFGLPGVRVRHVEGVDSHSCGADGDGVGVSRQPPRRLPPTAPVQQLIRSQVPCIDCTVYRRLQPQLDPLQQPKPLQSTESRTTNDVMRRRTAGRAGPRYSCELTPIGRWLPDPELLSLSRVALPRDVGDVAREVRVIRSRRERDVHLSGGLLRSGNPESGHRVTRSS